MNWSFYRLDNGQFGTFKFFGPQELVALNTPDGYAPIQGTDFDHLSQKVDIAATAAAQAAEDALPPVSPPTSPGASPDTPSTHVPTRVIVPPIVVDFQPPAPADDAGQTWAWNTTTKRWVSSPTLSALKAAKWEVIKAERDAREFGTFTWNGHVFDADAVSTGRVMGAFALALAATMAGQPYNVVWKLADNTTVAMTGTDMIAAGSVLGSQVSALHKTADDLYNSINAATSAVELDAIVWPT